MIDARVRRIVLVLVVSLPLLQLAPAAVGPWLAGEHEVFLGFDHLGLDFMAYASFLEQAHESPSPLMRNEFTLVPQAGRYILPLHWLIGRVAALGDTSIVHAWLLAQYLLGACLLYAIWRFLALVFEDPWTRLGAFVLAATSSGFSGVARLLGTGDEGVWRFLHPNLGWGSFNVLCSPLWAAAFLLFLAVLALVCVAVREERPVVLLPAPFLVTLLMLTHGYSAVALGAVLGGGLAWESILALRGHAPSRRSAFYLLLVLGSFAIPALVSQWQSSDAVYRMTSLRALQDGEVVPLWLWPVAFGPILLSGIAGVPLSLRDDRFPSRLVGAWIVAVFVLTQTPALSPARSLAFLHLPLCIATVLLFSRHAERIPPRLRSRKALAAAMFLLALPTLAAVISSIRDLRARPGYFLARDDAAALARLRVFEPGAVLASGRTSLYVPWLARKPVYLGHWFMGYVTDPATGEGVVANTWRFFGPPGPPSEAAWRREFLRRNGIRWVYMGPQERQLGGGLDGRLQLQLVLDLGAVKIYDAEGAAGAASSTSARDDDLSK